MAVAIIYLLVRLSKSEKSKNEAEGKYQILSGKISQPELETLESKLNPPSFQKSGKLEKTN